MWLKMLKPTFAPLLDTNVPSGVSMFLKSGEALKAKWLLKFFKRLAVFWFIGRLFGFVRYGDDVVTGVEKKILWINLSAPSLGDAMVDLAPARMLTGAQLWLLTSAKNAFLFAGSGEFHWVGTSTKSLREASDATFDVVIVDSLSPRVLWKKFLVAPTTKFCSVYGFVNGFDVHRLEFGHDRIAQIFGRQRKYAERPLLGLCAKQCPSKIKSEFIVIAVGGEWAFRTYQRWADVVSCIREQTQIPIVLLGSSNGLGAGEELASRNFTSCVNLVGTTTFHEAAYYIGESQLFLGADGGLWHVSCALNKPSVALFAECDIFSPDGSRCLRVPLEKSDCRWFYAIDEVSSIDPRLIAEATLAMLQESSAST